MQRKDVRGGGGGGERERQCQLTFIEANQKSPKGSKLFSLSLIYPCPHSSWSAAWQCTQLLICVDIDH